MSSSVPLADATAYHLGTNATGGETVWTEAMRPPRPAAWNALRECGAARADSALDLMTDLTENVTDGLTAKTGATRARQLAGIAAAGWRAVSNVRAGSASGLSTSATDRTLLNAMTGATRLLGAAVRNAPRDTSDARVDNALSCKLYGMECCKTYVMDTTTAKMGATRAQTPAGRIAVERRTVSNVQMGNAFMHF